MNTVKYSLEDMELHYYHDSSVKRSTGKLYDDNGETPEAFEKGEYELLKFTSKSTESKIKLELETEIGENYKAKDKRITWVLHHIEKKPKMIKIGKEAVDFTWDENSKQLQFKAVLSQNENQSVTIKLAK